MWQNHPEICLFQPEIPQNTGTIGRLAAATQCRLHLIRPFGFSTDDRHLKRAGLDYWPFLDLEIHDALDPLLSRFGDHIAFFSKHGEKTYAQVPSSTQLLIFGRETKGLTPEILQTHADKLYRIPIYHPGVRSLNLANAVSIVVYHQLLQKYPDHKHPYKKD